MKASSLSDGIFFIHADIETPDLFEGIWPIPHGVSLNSYLIKGQKTALIDLLMDWSGAVDQVEAALASIEVKFTDIDCLILNHLEPDHTGWLREFREQNPVAEILATQKG
jgi:flavorubredoxin